MKLEWNIGLKVCIHKKVREIPIRGISLENMMYWKLLVFIYDDLKNKKIRFVGIQNRKYFLNKRL